MNGGVYGELRRALNDDTMVVVAMPPLCLMLLDLETRKGTPLTEEEVLSAVEINPAITMLREHAEQLAETRGPDLDADNIWNDWLEFRAAMDEEED
jgi:hypothetical protein